MARMAQEAVCPLPKVTFLAHFDSPRTSTIIRRDVLTG